MPWNIQIAVAAREIDPERARGAINAVLTIHPLTRCAVERDERGRLSWINDDRAALGPVDAVDCPTPASLEQLRVGQLTKPLQMDCAPLMRAVVARTPDQDLLVVTISHVLTDGMGLLRLMRSIGCAYRDESDPPPAVDVATAQAALEPNPATTLEGLTRQWTTRLQLAASQLPRRSRLAASGGSPTGGFGFVLVSTELAAVDRARRALHASFDPFTTAALHVAIERWNSARGAPCDRVGVTQGVNLRPDAWRDDAVLNLAAFASIFTDPSDRTDLARALDKVTSQIEPSRRLELAREVATTARSLRLIPATTRRDMLAALPADQFDTCVISNCGMLADPPRLDDTTQPMAWLIAPAMPATALTIATYAVGDRLYFNACYRRERLDADAARRFVESFVGLLT